MASRRTERWGSGARRRVPSCVWPALSSSVLAVCLLGLAVAGAAEDWERRVPARPGGTLELELDGGSVEIESDSANEVQLQVRISGPRSRQVGFEIESDDGDVSIEGRSGGWLADLVGPRVRIRVLVPHEYSVEVETHGGSVSIEDLRGDVEVRTSGGSIQIEEVQGDVDVETSGGSIKGEDIRGDFKARTSGSRIRLVEITGEIDVETSGGPIRARDIGGPIRARTSGGSVSIRFSGLPAGEIETSGGSIDVGFPEWAGVKLEAETSGGRVDLDREFRFSGQTSRSRVKGEVGDGGEDLRLKTSGGNIRIRAD